MRNLISSFVVLTVALLITSGSFAQQPDTKKGEAKKTQTQTKPAVVPLSTTVKPAADVTALQPEKAGKLYGGWMLPAAKLSFPRLPYDLDALEPVIDKLTVEIHYDRHHRAYYNNFIKAVTGTEMENMSIFEIFSKMSELPVPVRNNGGGFFNHVLYWNNLSPKGGGEPGGELAEAITKYFGSFEAFRAKFEEAAKTRFGSGWAWLSVDPEKGELFISSTANQDNPLMNTESRRGFPILGIDVWEHAYYLRYQNKRADYVESFWKIVNWQDVEANYKQFYEMKDKLFR